MSGDARRQLGRRGEARAARFLRRQGLRIVARNWTCPSGEIDLLARDGDVLVVVEVRTAGKRPYAGAPELTVGADKQRRLARLAQRWLAQSAWKPAAVRFDVIGVTRLGWFRWDVRWYRNAFEPAP